jgi:predicted RNase H-like HicB family nuclease
MHNEFEAIIEQDGDWFIAYSPEIPGANGQGRTADEARASLSEAIALMLEDRREDAHRGLPSNAIRSSVVVA